MNRVHQRLLGLLLLTPGLAHSATYLDDIGYVALAARLGPGTPNGAGVPVMMVEASVGDEGGDPLRPIWSPVSSAGSSAAPFSGVNFVLRNGPSGRSTTTSAHASGVATLFFGDESIASGVSTVEAALAEDWLQSGFLHLGDVDPARTPNTTASRIINHSWVGRFANGSGATLPVLDAEALRRTDWLVQRDSVVNVVGMNNGTVNRVLLGSSFNSIAVGLTSASSAQGAVSLQGTDPVYAPERTRPDVVAPAGVTSAAAPMVSALSALLVQTGHEGAEKLSNGSMINRAGVTVYNAERAETIKAALMAGADRATGNEASADQITDYRAAGFATPNGLDSRYGAGQINAVNSYNIIAAGEREPGAIGCSTAVLVCAGFDYNGSFAGGSGTAISYTFTADGARDQLSASLVWNLDVQSFAAGGEATLYQLGLSLFDATTNTLVATSRSLSDNSQNLWLRLIAGHDYTMQVFSLQPGAFAWSYALAWNISAAPVPLPASLWMMLAGLGVIVRHSRAAAQR